MPLSQKQKQIRDKKVEDLTNILFQKQEQINRNISQHNDLMVKLQEEKDEIEVLKQALENLK